MSELVTTTERVAAERNHPIAAVEVPRTKSTSPRRGGSWRPFLFGIVALGAIAGGIYAGVAPRLRHERELVAAAAEVANAKPRVTVVTAHAAMPDAERVLPGSSLPLLETAIYARTTGYLKSRRVDIGDHVKEGDLLAEIAAPEIDAQLEQARATLLLTRATWSATRPARSWRTPS